MFFISVMTIELNNLLTITKYKNQKYNYNLLKKNFQKLNFGI